MQRGQTHRMFSISSGTDKQDQQRLRFAQSFSEIGNRIIVVVVVVAVLHHPCVQIHRVARAILQHGIPVLFRNKPRGTSSTCLGASRLCRIQYATMGAYGCGCACHAVGFGSRIGGGWIKEVVCCVGCLVVVSRNVLYCYEDFL